MTLYRNIIKRLGGVALLMCGAEALANYQAAQTAYARHDYATAASAYFQAYSSGNGTEKLYSEWGLAQSLHHMNYLYSASKYYSVIVRRGPSPHNPYFRKALEELGNINSTISLGQSHVVQLFKTKIDPSYVPGPARGFFFYYEGIESFNQHRFEEASNFFRRVPSGSPYYLRALFHLGVIANLSGNHSRAISYFESVRAGARGSGDNEALRESANLNIARVLYETKRYKDAIQYYGQVSRESRDNWLEAIFESGWAFFLMQKHNNTLGNIHTILSPFFETRFFPESYILQAVTFLRLCRYDEVKRSLTNFKNRYGPVFQDVKNILSQYDKNQKGFFKLIYDYSSGSLNSYKNAWAVLDAVSRTDAFREANTTIRLADTEIANLGSMSGRWNASGLQEELKDFLTKKKSAAVADAAGRLYDKAAAFYSYLKELSDQTKLINAEMVLGRVDAVRRQLNVGQADAHTTFIGGLQPLNVGQELEYWPFEGEYWEDELGFYVYNIDSKCNAPSSDKKEKDK